MPDYDFLRHFSSVKRTCSGWTARCPAHDDRHASLSISRGEDCWLICCHAGCTAEQIVETLGIKLSDLFDGEPGAPTEPSTKTKWEPMTPAGSDPPSDPDHPRLGRADQAWTYHDADGRVMFLVCRWDKPDGKLILP